MAIRTAIKTNIDWFKHDLLTRQNSFVEFYPLGLAKVAKNFMIFQITNDVDYCTNKVIGPNLWVTLRLESFKEHAERNEFDSEDIMLRDSFLLTKELEHILKTCFHGLENIRIRKLRQSDC